MTTSTRCRSRRRRPRTRRGWTGICQPLPLQEGGIPLWIAGGGERKTPRIAAQYAAYTNFDPSPEGFARKSALLEEHCREVAGRQVQAMSKGRLAGTTEQVTERLAELNDMGMTHAIMTIPDVAYDRSGLRLAPEKVIPGLT